MHDGERDVCAASQTKSKAQRDAIVDAAEEGQEELVRLVLDGEGGGIGVAGVDTVQRQRARERRGAIVAVIVGACTGSGTTAEVVVDEDARVAGSGGERLLDEGEVLAAGETLSGRGRDADDGGFFVEGAVLAPGEEDKVGGDVDGAAGECLGVGGGGDDGDFAGDGDVVEARECAEGVDDGVVLGVVLFAFGDVHHGRGTFRQLEDAQAVDFERTCGGSGGVVGGAFAGLFGLVDGVDLVGIFVFA